MSTKAYVYAIRHISTGDSYVGCTRNKSQRWARHRSLLKHGKHHSRRLQSLWDQEGLQAFDFVILEAIEAPTTDLQYSRELHWVSVYGTLNTQIANNGVDAFTLRPDDAEQRRVSSLERVASDPDLREFLTERGRSLAELSKLPESRAAMSIHSKRRWQNPKEAAKLRAGLERRWQDPEERVKASERIKNAPDELRKKRASSLAATWADPERNNTLMESRKKRWADPEAKAKQAEKMRQIWAQRRMQKD
jgi:hypothetical protein